MKPKNQTKHFTIACLLIAWNVSTQADILTDGTVGDIYYLFGDNMIIPENYGTRVGDNLFHSFAMFNIYSGEAVTFTGSNTLQNVIARVTGGDVSMINGILSSNIGKANFYFINPAGVTFGKNAVVDVPAAFHVSTANQINFADGSIYSATNPAVSTLTIAKPESFGFLGQTGDIVLDGVQIIAKPNQTIDLVANNISLKNNADLYAPAGEVRLVAAKGNQNVSLVRDENGFLPLPSQTPNAENVGNILMDNSVIDTTGNGGGRAALWGNNIMLNNSGLFADNDGFLDAIEGKGINIQANSLSVNNNSMITSVVASIGNSGNIVINTNSLNIFNGGFLGTATFSSGDAGNIDVFTNRLKIDGQNSRNYTGITSQVVNGSGNGGNIKIQADKLDILNEGEISGLTWAQGNSGDVTVKAEQLKIDGEKGDAFTGIASQAGANSRGNAGDVIINAGNLEILNGGEVSASAGSFSQGNAGNVIITANRLIIDSQENDIPTGIFSQALPQSSGHSGNIIVNTDSLHILNGGVILSNTFSGGNAGNISVSANQLFIDGQGEYGTGISAGAFYEGSSGNAGNITINAGSLDILNGGRIDSSTLSQANAGQINVSATTINMDNGFIVAAASPDSMGNTNAVIINANNLNLSNGSQITVANYGSGDAGNIFLNTHTVSAENNSFISTFANTGSGGNINISASDYIYLENSAITTTTYGDNTHGGDINIDAGVLVMNTGLIQANAEGGRGGDIDLNIQALIPSYNSLIIGGTQVSWQPYIPGFNVIQAASATGVSGNITIASPQFDISGSISGLKTNYLTPPDVNRDPCQNVTASSLKRGGKGGLPINEIQTGFIPPVASLPSSSDKPISEEPQKTSQNRVNYACKAATI